MQEIESPLSLSREFLDKSECENLVQLCFQVKHECYVCVQARELVLSPNYYLRSEVAGRLHQRLINTYKLLSETEFIDCLKYIYSFAGRYDYQDVRANGFRSFLSIVSCCLFKIVSCLRDLDRRAFSLWSFAFLSPTLTDDYLIAYLRCLEELAFCTFLISQFPKFSDQSSNLFPQLCYTKLSAAQLPMYDSLGPPLRTSNLLRDFSNMNSPTSSDSSLSYYSTLIDYFDLVQQDVFYGRAMAFYLDTSAQNFLKICGCIMAGFGKSYQNAMEGVPGFVNALFHSVASFLSPEKRGYRISYTTRSADVYFCKRLWNLMENRFLVFLSKLLLPQMAVCHTFYLPNVPVALATEPHESSPVIVTINPPSGAMGISVRLISKVRRRGMAWALNQEPVDGRNNKATRKTSLLKPPSLSVTSSSCLETDPSHFLLVHIHGGGFVAQSSEGHDAYLRLWAEKLDCPIISLNYSLAPESPYPRALDECFHAVCWVMANRELLGARPNARVVVCGDSAGGNLSLGVCLRCAALGLSSATSRPVGALIAYAPAVLANIPTPSRVLSICDPVLPLGITLRCIMAYAGIDEASFDRQSSTPKSVSTNYPSKSHQPPNRSTSAPLWSRLWSIWFSSSLPPVLPPTSSLDRLHMISRRGVISSEIQHNVKCEGSNQAHFNGVASPSTFSPNSSEFSDANDSEESVYGEKCANNKRSNSIPNFDDGLSYGIDERLQSIRNCPIPQDPFLSPYFASDELLRLLPPLAIVACQYDPFLDDAVELAKRAKAVGVPVELHVADGMPHAFLSMCFVNPDYRREAMNCTDMIVRLLRGEV